jgi:hypothetical protein
VAARPTLPLAPRSVGAFCRRHSDFLSLHAHEACAALFALAHWGQFLANLGLADRAHAADAWRSFREEARVDLAQLLAARLEEQHDRDAANELHAFLAT